MNEQLIKLLADIETFTLDSSHCAPNRLKKPEDLKSTGSKAKDSNLWPKKKVPTI